MEFLIIGIIMGFFIGLAVGAIRSGPPKENMTFSPPSPNLPPSPPPPSKLKEGY